MQTASVAVTHRPHFERRAHPYRVMDRLVPGASGILFKDGEEWVRRLRVLMPSFTPTRIDTIGGEISRGAAEERGLAARGVFDETFTRMNGARPR